jgi:hypothetical protein
MSRGSQGYDPEQSFEIRESPGANPLDPICLTACF